MAAAQKARHAVLLSVNLPSDLTADVSVRQRAAVRVDVVLQVNPAVQTDVPQLLALHASACAPLKAAA